jgi:hypothetical protein
MQGARDIANTGPIRLIPFWLVLGSGLLGVLFLIADSEGNNPGGVRLGDPRFLGLFALDALILIPLLVLLLGGIQMFHAPRRIRVSETGFSYESWRWINHGLRRVRVEVRVANVRAIKPWGLGLFFGSIRSTATETGGGRSLTRRDYVFLDRAVVELLGLEPVPFRLIYTS